MVVPDSDLTQVMFLGNDLTYTHDGGRSWHSVTYTAPQESSKPFGLPSVPLAAGVALDVHRGAYDWILKNYVHGTFAAGSYRPSMSPWKALWLWLVCARNLMV